MISNDDDDDDNDDQLCDTAARSPLEPAYMYMAISMYLSQVDSGIDW